MATQTEMIQALSQLRPMVMSQDFGKIDAFAAKWGLDFLISKEFIDFSRCVKDPGCVIFLSTLGVHNAKDSAEPQLILDAYQSITAGSLTTGIKQLPKRHVLRQSIALLAEKEPLPAARVDSQRRKGTDSEWLLAFELCLDHDALTDALTLLIERMNASNTGEFALLSAKALVERGKGVTVQDTLPWQGWIALQTAVYNELKRRKLNDSAEAMVQVIGEYCHFAADYQASIDWFKKLNRKSDNYVAVLYQLAREYSHLQDFDTAISYLDDLLDNLNGKSDEWIDSKFPEANLGGKKSSNAQFNINAAAVALKDLQTALAPMDLSPFLVSGTLLGYVRNRGFLSHDKDIDVGIYSSQSIFDVVDVLSRSGLFSVFHKYLRIEKTYHVPVRHRATGMSIDIFVYHPEDGKMVTGVQSAFGYTQNFAFSPFTLQTVEFLGIDFAIPANAELKLEENFGNWQVSDPYYISHLQCPVTVDVGGPVYMLVARLEMLRAVVDGKKVKFDRTANILRNWSHAPHAMAPDLIDRLEARFGSAAIADQRTTENEAPAHV